MNQIWISFALISALLFASPSPAPACSICGGDFRTRPTLRQQASSAAIVVFGSLSNAKLDTDPASGGGTTELKIAQVLKSTERLAAGSTIRIPRYLPSDDKREALVFFGLRDGKWEFLGVRTTTG